MSSSLLVQGSASSPPGNSRREQDGSSFHGGIHDERAEYKDLARTPWKVNRSHVAGCMAVRDELSVIVPVGKNPSDFLRKFGNEPRATFLYKLDRP